ncbi:hypothetical protein [Novosphingobium terrae]|uniref:hypothetical protein n=1 Tax=Novosphingobium terrae TaxID=2726189 RepID=UPI00197E63AD|nr:hypothetical protein [Novosphingobium terrae]
MIAHHSRWMASTMAAAAGMLLSLSACAGDSHLAYGSVGTPGGTGSSGSDGSGGGTGGSGNTGGSGSTGGSGGTGGTGGTQTAASSDVQTVLAQAGPALVTAGNASLGLASGVDGATTTLASAVPITAPITGTVTRVLGDTGQVLVDTGNGKTLLLDGVQKVVGDAVTINLGNQAVTTSADGTPGAVGLSVLSPTQAQGTLASAGVLTSGQVATANVNGVANVAVANVTAPGGGLSNQLLNVAVADHQILGSGDPALINANLLSGAAGSGLTSGGAVLTPVTSLLTNVTNGGLTNGGTATGGLLKPVTGLVGTVAGTTTAATTPATVNAGATATAGNTTATGTLTGTTTGLLKPVTTAVGNTVSTLTGGTLLSGKH